MLLHSAIEGYIPVTDSQIHKNLLNLKLNRTLKVLKENKIIKNELIPDLQYELPKEQLAIALFDEIVPNEELSKRTISEIVEYKKENLKSYERLQIKLGELASEIDNVGYDDNYYREIKKIIDKDVKPELLSIRDELSNSYEKSFGRLTIRSAGVVIPALTLSIIGGLGFGGVLGACALAELGYLSTKGTNDLIDVITTFKGKKRNNYSYLLGI